MALTLEAPVLVVAAVFAALAAGLLGSAITLDSWLGLVGGREVARGGPPSVDHLTVWTAGREWIDQQWLGQWLLWTTYRTGGLATLGVLHLVVVLGALAIVIVAARRRGGAPAHVALVAAVALVPYLQVAGNVRTQSLALPLFAGVLVLVTRHIRAPGRAVWWAPIGLLVWANVHGSVVVGAGLVVLAGSMELLQGGSRGRAVALLFVGPGLTLATPYGLDGLVYIRDLLGDDELVRIASDWRPTTLEAGQATSFLLGGVALGLAVRPGSGLLTSERLVLVLGLAGALSARRNLAFLALASVLLLPAAITSLRAGRARPGLPARFGEPLGVLAVVGVLVAVVMGPASMAASVEERFPRRAAARVAQVAGAAPGAVVWADPAWADWLLLYEPSLRGRLAFDVRYELLETRELREYRSVRDRTHRGWRVGLRGARFVVGDRGATPSGGGPASIDVLARDPGARELAAAGELLFVRLPG